jgi:hypothetical protein
MPDIEDGLKNAVDALAQGLPSPTEVAIGPFTMAGTEIPTGLSRYLTEAITFFAETNMDHKYIVKENEADFSQITVLHGFFTRRDDLIDLTLEIVNPNGDVNGSKTLTASVSVLADLGIAIEPENLAIALEQEEVIATVLEVPNAVNSQTHQGINIQASFNSESMTYLHREELGMTILADRDCYFKVIHIDADNKVKMIYPNSNDRNNQLRANVPRAIFETASYMLYEPYGAETIIIAASTEQYANIEQEYIVPWVAASGDTVRGAIRGRRGGELESRPSATVRTGETAYTIAIRKPHEEYEYARPENTRELYETIRTDVLSQGGDFEGNETSGYYIVNEVRTSYRIPRDKPDAIQFAVYYMDNFTRGTRSGVRARGAGFSFNFNRPGNLPQAVQSVRSKIEEKGGTFTGNEQQGSFQANGITGQYRVSTQVSVTISEKPFMIPNSLIEREVRNYFGER